MIKDVMDTSELELRPDEDVVLYGSKFTQLPTKTENQYTFYINDLSSVLASPGNEFEVSKLYFGIYSMSGITLRFSFGFAVDPHYCNAALMRKTAKITSKKSKEAA